MGGAEEAGFVRVGAGVALGSSPRKGGQSRDLHSGALGVRGRGWASGEPREVPAGHKENLSPHADCRAVAQVAQR